MFRILLTVFFYICKNTIAEPIKKWKKGCFGIFFFTYSAKKQIYIFKYMITDITVTQMCRQVIILFLI